MIIKYHLDNRINIEFVDVNLLAIKLGKQIFRCKCGNRHIIFHHEKYFEFDGYDEVHIICRKCHYNKGIYYLKYNLNRYDFKNISKKSNIRLYSTLTKYLGTDYKHTCLWVNPYEN